MFTIPRKVQFLSLIIVAIIIFSSPSYSKEPQYLRDFEQNDRNYFLLTEAISVIKEIFLFSDQENLETEILSDGIKSYLTTKDKYSDYLSPQEYLSFKALQKKHYAGVGMQIEKNADWQIVCLPSPGGPAEKAGIANGDILKHIDGQEILNNSLYAAASKIIGPTGTVVRFDIENEIGLDKKVTVTRSQIKSEKVLKYKVLGIPVIQISGFGLNTKREFKQILLELDKAQPLIIDLRDNRGGDFHIAIDSAMLFLENGKEIASVISLKGITSYSSTDNAVNTSSPVFILQNERTASAAEIFIAALIDNNRAESIGTTSYGKGVKQDIIELSDGSALILTTGYLKTPKGVIFHEKGLPPTHLLSIDNPTTINYLRKARQLILDKD